jgi:hypothetical protein
VKIEHLFDAVCDRVFEPIGPDADEGKWVMRVVIATLRLLGFAVTDGSLFGPNAGGDVIRDPMQTLARNLAVAAGLHEAHWLALGEAEDHRLYHEHGYRTDGCWSPGCGKPAAGWGAP